MAALLTSDRDNSDRIAIEINECRSQNIDILPPSINDSLRDFTVVKNRQIRFGLGGIKNLGASAIEAILKARGEDNIHFQDLDDFLNRIEISQLNRKNLEALVKSGALDDFGKRSQLMNNIEEMIQHGKEQQKQTETGQMDLFGSLENQSLSKIQLRSGPEAPFSQILKWEKEHLGLYVSTHPLAGLQEFWKKYSFDLSQTKIQDIGKSIKIAGIVQNYRMIKTKNGDYMGSFWLSTPLGDIECTIFPKHFESYRETLQEDLCISLQGKLTQRNQQLQILGDEIHFRSIDDFREQAIKENLFLASEKHLASFELPVFDPEEIQAAKREAWIIDIPENINRESLQAIKQILKNNPGYDNVIFKLNTGEKIPFPQKIKLTKILQSQILQLINL